MFTNVSLSTIKTISSASKIAVTGLDWSISKVDGIDTSVYGGSPV